MTTRSEETQIAVRDAMERYKTLVLAPERLDRKTRLYGYAKEITAAEVLRMAGVRSRATLSAPYHRDLREDLDRLIADLKRQTGKGKAAKAQASSDRSARQDRLDQLTQTIAALQYRIIALEQELATYRRASALRKTVVDFKTAGRPKL